MIQSTLSEIASGLLVDVPSHDVSFVGVGTDSRTIDRGSLYIPLRGEYFDGHDFVRAALQNGAAGFLWDRTVALPDEFVSMPHLLVQDTLAALQSLAQWYRRALPVNVVAITGSNGKTSTKDLVACVLSVHFTTYKTDGNLNNHIGLPLSILRLPKDTQIAVLEMGMNSLGEIKRLCEIAQPDIGVITNIGEAHIGRLGSRANIARAKWELIESLGSGALAIVPDDEPLIEQLSVPYGVSVWRFGESARADVGFTNYGVRDSASLFTLLPEGLHVKLPVLGKHQVCNAVCALAVAKFLGVDLTLATAALESVSLTKMRMEIVSVSDEITLINDAYNAAPSSTYAALDVLKNLPGDYRIAVLGDMMELGQESERLHEEVGIATARSGVNVLLAVGQFADQMVKGAVGVQPHMEALAVQGIAEAQPILQSWLQSENRKGKTLILVKASRSMKFEQLVKQIVAYDSGHFE